MTTSLSAGEPASRLQCEMEEFRCGEGQCISWTKLCDGESDCDDRSDETNADCSGENTVMMEGK